MKLCGVFCVPSCGLVSLIIMGWISMKCDKSSIDLDCLINHYNPIQVTDYFNQFYVVDSTPNVNSNDKQSITNNIHTLNSKKINDTIINSTYVNNIESIESIDVNSVNMDEIIELSNNDPSMYWSINWNLFKKTLTHNTDFLETNKDTNEPLPFLNVSSLDDETIKNSITWNNPNYKGYCRPNFYPYIGAAHWKHENGLKRVVNSIKRVEKNIDPTHHLNEEELESLLSSDMDNIPQYIYHIFDYYNTSNFNFNQVDNDLIVKKSLGIEFTKQDKIDYFKYTQSPDYNSDAERVDYFRNLRTSVRFDDTVFTHNPLTNRYNVEIIVAINCPKKPEWQIHYDDYIPYNMLEEGISRWGGFTDARIDEIHYYNYEYELIDTSMAGTQYLCVFSNGISVVSKKVRKANDIRYWNTHYIVECDITDYPSIVNVLNNQDSNYNNEETNLGVSLFALNFKETEKQLLNEYLIAMNVQLPICSTVEINRPKTKIYKDSNEYHAESSNKFHKMKVITDFNKDNKHIDDNDISNENILSNVQIPDEYLKYKYSAMTLIHPSLRSGQMDLLTSQWIDYHLFQGINHFYLYDHLMNREDNNINYFYDALNEYIESDIVTLIDWPQTVRSGEIRAYEVSAQLDAMRRFRYETKWLTLHDVDEWIIIVKEDSEDLDEQDSNELVPTMESLFAQSNQNFGQMLWWALHVITDFYDENSLSRLGCTKSESKHNRFNTYLERQSCTSTSIDNDELINSYFEKHVTPSIKLKYNINQDINVNDLSKDTKLLMIRDGIESIDYIKDLRSLPMDGGKSLNWKKSLVEIDNIHNQSLNISQELLFFDALSQYKWWMGFGTVPKLMVNPMLTFNGFQHFTSLYNNRAMIPNKHFDNKTIFNEYSSKNQYYNQPINDDGVHHLYDNMKDYNKLKHGYESGNIISDVITDLWDPPMWDDVNPKLSKKYKVVLAHTADHWRLFNIWYKNNKVIDYKNGNDTKLLHEVVHSKCEYKNDILYWNERFLNSKYGKKWDNRNKIAPIFDEDGRYCYHTQPNFNEVWAIEQ